MTEKTLEEIQQEGSQKKNEYHKMRDLCDDIVIEVFKNTVGIIYAYTGDNKLLNVNSDDLKRYMACEYEDKYNMQPKEATIKQIQMHLIGRARNTPVKETFIRVGQYKKDWYYDLADGNSVKIRKDRWEITKTPSIFPTDVRTQVQIHPIQVDEPLKHLEKLINILNLSDERQKNLFIFMLITCFIPKIKHPLVMIEGPMGSAKSTFAEIMQSIISPSGFGHIGHDKVMDIALQFSNRYVRSLDNVSEIGNNFSDMLCKAATGGEYTKRTAYTNTDETSMVLHKGVTFINGIGIAGRADMNERSVILRLRDLSDKQKVSRNHLDEMINKMKPVVLGAIFTVLSNVRAISDKMVIEDKYRMSDFTAYCRLISMVLWDDIGPFESAMELNEENIALSTYDSSYFAEYIIDQMRMMNNIEGTMSYIYNSLMNDYFNEKNKSMKLPEGFPTHANKMRTCLIRIEAELRKNNIIFEQAGYRKFSIKIDESDDEFLEKNVQ